MASLGIGYDDLAQESLTFKLTSDSDYLTYVYPYMLSDYGTFLDKMSEGLFSAGFWRDDNWMVCLF